MKGTRPLDNDEIRLVSACFTGTFEARNRGLFMLGVSTGGRISELLSLTIADVYQNRRVRQDRNRIKLKKIGEIYYNTSSFLNCILYRPQAYYSLKVFIGCLDMHRKRGTAGDGAPLFLI